MMPTRANPRQAAAMQRPAANIPKMASIGAVNPAQVLPGPGAAPQKIGSAGPSPGGQAMPRPALMAKGGKVTSAKKSGAKKPAGLYANINAKRKRIAEGSGEKMRKPGTKGAPTAKAFRESAKTAKKGTK